jgi:RHS repeat-associated protein
VISPISNAQITWRGTLGSPIRQSSSSGTNIGTEQYDPRGVKLNGVPEKIGFTGHVFDENTGLTYMQARFYDAAVGRFLSTDPIEFDGRDPATFNRYAYANNNPYRYIDPTGASGCKVSVGGCADDSFTGIEDPADRTEGEAPKKTETPKGGDKRPTQDGDDGKTPDPSPSEPAKNGKTEADSGSEPTTTEQVLDVVSVVLTVADIILGGPTGEGIAPAILIQSIKKGAAGAAGKTFKNGREALERDQQFRRWFHREFKPDSIATGGKGGRTNPDVNLDGAYKQWLGEGRPGVK